MSEAEAELSPLSRTIVMTALTGAVLMMTLDQTIANVALPHIQGSVSASQEQIAWVLTSYVIAMAIGTPPSGWLARRYGIRNLLLASIAGFTITSLMCASATDILQLVLFRFLQGLSGAVILPLAQSMMVTMNPGARLPAAMAVFSMGALLGPILGPLIGGFITEHWSWRWVFLINLPMGALTFIALLIFLPSQSNRTWPRFDFYGFATLSIALVALQLLLDRGQVLDWFASPEICTYAALSCIFFLSFIVLAITSEEPFLNLQVLRDRNLSASILLNIVLTSIMFANLALLPQMMQNILGYSAMATGIAMAPRGLGSFIGIAFAGRFGDRFEKRSLVAIAWAILILSQWGMMNFTLEMDRTPIIVNAFFQGVGIGLAYGVINTLAFTSVPASHVPDASVIFILLRNLASGIGISIFAILQISHAVIIHSGLVDIMQPTAQPGLLDMSPGGLAMLNAGISQQAGMAAYADNFKLNMILCILTMPLLLLLKPGAKKKRDEELAPVMD